MVWQRYKIRTGLRKLRELRTGRRETRGRPELYDDEDRIRFYIEVEARARVLAEGVISNLLDHPHLRLQTIAGSRRLNKQDKQLVRRQHSEGYREARVWKDMQFAGRSHPRWAYIERLIDLRETQLRSTARSELFFLKTM